MLDDFKDEQKYTNAYVFYTFVICLAAIMTVLILMFQDW